MACRTARSRIRRLAFQLIFQASGSSPLDTARPVHSWLPRRRSLSRLETMRVPCGHLNYECPHNSSYYSKKAGKSLRKCGNSTQNGTIKRGHDMLSPIVYFIIVGGAYFFALSAGKKFSMTQTWGCGSSLPGDEKAMRCPSGWTVRNRIKDMPRSIFSASPPSRETR